MPNPRFVFYPHDLLTLKELELELIDEAIRRAGGDKVKAAKLIGIGKTTLYAKLKKRKEERGA